mmetsp:Transcript_17124/g.42018  ORF Transcript_17124/g.42018 Transcript_17124/m.42018 type:complete len:310 (+) Transcript_17124:586-1515(+)
MSGVIRICSSLTQASPITGKPRNRESAVASSSSMSPIPRATFRALASVPSLPIGIVHSPGNDPSRTSRTCEGVDLTSSPPALISKPLVPPPTLGSYSTATVGSVLSARFVLVSSCSSSLSMSAFSFDVFSSSSPCASPSFAVSSLASFSLVSTTLTSVPGDLLQSLSPACFSLAFSLLFNIFFAWTATELFFSSSGGGGGSICGDFGNCDCICSKIRNNAVHASTLGKEKVSPLQFFHLPSRRSRNHLERARIPGRISIRLSDPHERITKRPSSSPSGFRPLANFSVGLRFRSPSRSSFEHRLAAPEAA